MNQLLGALTYYHNGDPKKDVQNIELDNGRRTIGPNSASEIYAACCTLEDGSTVLSHNVELTEKRKPKLADTFG